MQLVLASISYLETVIDSLFRYVLRKTLDNADIDKLATRDHKMSVTDSSAWEVTNKNKINVNDNSAWEEVTNFVTSFFF